MRAPHLPSNPIAAAITAVVRFAAKVQEAQGRRRVMYGLATLDDHMLRDIGLTRCDVDAALVESTLTDGTLLLAERAREARLHQRALAQEAQAWAMMAPADGGRGNRAVKRVA